MAQCRGTAFNDPQQMQSYFSAVEDPDGGSTVAKCWHDSWWVAPACRDDLAKCIPVVTANPGWSLANIMRIAHDYHMPFIIGVAKNWEDYLAAPVDHDVVFYWWWPDESFALLEAKKVTFAEASLWPDVRLQKYVYKYLPETAADAFGLAQSLQLNHDEMLRMLHQSKLHGDPHKIACDWVKSSTASWAAWTPTTTVTSRTDTTTSMPPETTMPPETIDAPREQDVSRAASLGVLSRRAYAFMALLGIASMYFP